MPPRWNKRGDGYQPQWNVVQDAGGAILGTYYADRQPLQEHVRTIRDFLIHFKRQEKEMSATKTEKVNVVYLGGHLKFDPQVFDNAVKALIDTGQKQSIPVGVRKGASTADDVLADKLAKFRKGDLIQVVAILEPYGVKQDDGSWKNGMAIRITEIRTPTPARKEPARQQQSFGDDRVPF